LVFLTFVFYFFLLGPAAQAGLGPAWAAAMLRGSLLLASLRRLPLVGSLGPSLFRFAQKLGLACGHRCAALGRSAF